MRVAFLSFLSLGVGVRVWYFVRSWFSYFLPKFAREFHVHVLVVHVLYISPYYPTVARRKKAGKMCFSPSVFVYPIIGPSIAGATIFNQFDFRFEFHYFSNRKRFFQRLPGCKVDYLQKGFSQTIVYISACGLGIRR